MTKQYLYQSVDGSRNPICKTEYDMGVLLDKYDHVINTPTVVVVRDRAGTMPKRSIDMGPQYKYGGRGSVHGYRGN